MKKIFMALVLASIMVIGTGCTRIETGEVGLRVDMSKQVQGNELMAGSWNQVLVGDVLTFPVRDVNVEIDNLTPLAADNSTMKDFDLAVIYNITPSNVSDLYINKSKSFHELSKDGDVLLMYQYVYQTARNAVFKAARKYEALTMNDNRSVIEQEIQETIIKTLKEENIVGINITQVRVGAMTPSDTVKRSADELVRAKNERLTKEVEVQIAKKEAERIAALNANAGAVGYMAAQAQMEIAKGIAAGKVNTVVVPYDFKGAVHVYTKEK